MKANHKIIIILTCVAVVLPLSVQGGKKKARVPIETSTDSVKKDTDSVVNAANKNENMVPNYNDSIRRFDSVKKNDDLLIACFIVCLFTLIASIISIILNRKKMTVDNDNSSEERIVKQVAEMQIKLDQMQKLMEDMLAKQSSLLGEFITRLGTVQQIVTPQNRNVHPQCVSKSANVKQDSQIDKQSEPIPKSTEPPTKPISPRIFYATPSTEDGKVVLTPVDAAYVDRVAFVVKADGNEGTYRFNESATKFVINYLDNMVTPYCDCSLKTNNIPNNISTENDGAVRKQGDKWIVVKKALVKVS